MSVRVLLAKPGLDVHDRGIRMIARACRDAGMEVVLLGAGIVTVKECVATAVQEDVDVIGLSIMTGTPEVLCAEALTELERRNASEIPLVVGGVIRATNQTALRNMGVAGVFATGAPLDQIIDTINELASQRHNPTGQS